MDSGGNDRGFGWVVSVHDMVTVVEMTEGFGWVVSDLRVIWTQMSARRWLAHVREANEGWRR